MRRLSGRQWCGGAILLLVVLYFHAVMPLWEFIVVLVIVGVPAGVAGAVTVMALRSRRPAQDKGVVQGAVQGDDSPLVNRGSGRGSGA